MEIDDKSAPHSHLYLSQGKSPIVQQRLVQQQEKIGPLGPLTLLILPKGWTKSSSSDNARGYCHRFSPSDNAKVSISVLYRVPPLSQSEADALKKLLKAGPHTLSDDDLKPLPHLLGDYRDESVFKTEKAEVTAIGGKPVLSIQGHFLDDDVSVYTVYNPASHDPRVVQQLQFNAPTAQYKKYASAARSAILNASLH